MNKLVSRATGAAAIALSVDPGRAFQLEEVKIHLNAVGETGNLTATIDSAAGAPYDCVVLNQDMTAVTNLLFQPDRPIILFEDDKLNFAWANANLVTYGIEVIYSLI